MAKIRKGDLVEVRKGKDRAKRGKVLTVRPQSERLVVEGLNLTRRHRRARKAGQKGQIVSLPRQIPFANVMLICPGCNKASRIGAQQREKMKLRVCKRCNNEFA